jgi:hypothetical protein
MEGTNKEMHCLMKVLNHTWKEEHIRRRIGPVEQRVELKLTHMSDVKIDFSVR